MSTRIEIKKICQFCGEVFTAKTTVTKYCSDRCAKMDYRKKIRDKKIDNAKLEEISKLNSTDLATINIKEYLTPVATGILLGVSKATIYRYLENNVIKCVRIRGKTFIRKSDIEKMFDNAEPYKKKEMQVSAGISEFYTLQEIKEKYKVKERWFYEAVKKHTIPKVFTRGKNYYSEAFQKSVSEKLILIILAHEIREEEKASIRRFDT